ncbi:uncharacterized protein MAM_02572 [Metarhizium album ARSEF 1941]|uniref:Uncharacterized protein n=1 Tax=Metarhizium album (strain ARSEF 1941) TaxID=1081103 RepID=A0A0B2X1J2_METAS|nr:uncharacterized protein MAM_02572 [Metarhizium album ARSEF 1941]KHN99719.1 hypothetical protein MAM_02572 [Metarhizium album ARSEF 1941]
MYSTRLFGVLPLLAIALATPVDKREPTDLQLLTTDVTPSSPLLERADSCQVLDSVLDRIGTSSEVVVYASTGGLTALYVCKRTRGQNCEELAGAIASAIASIFLILKRSGAISARDGQAVESLVDFLAREFGEDGATFDSIKDATPHVLARYESGERRPVEVASIQGLSSGNNTINMDVYDFGNGDGHIYLPHDVLTKRSDDYDAASRFEKRAGAPGFKVSYTTRLKSKLTRAHQISMSQKLASWWANRAKCCNMHDMIGFVETGHAANFYYRIIPETVNFGLNYETVDSCGQMARYL